MLIDEKDFEDFAWLLEDFYEQEQDFIIQWCGDNDVDYARMIEVKERVVALETPYINARPKQYEDESPTFDVGTVPIFDEHPGTFRDQAMKVIEEAAELFSEAQMADKRICYANKHDKMLEEAGDVLQAVVNLFDMCPRWMAKNALKRTWVKNARRGRY